MEKCLYKGKEIFASDVYSNFEYEESIREAGRKNQLRCCGEHCNAQIIYNHGEKRIPYFSHYRPKLKCDYDSYFRIRKIRNDTTRRIIAYFFDIFKTKYGDEYAIKRDDKLIHKHWTDISVKRDNKILAIEFLNGYRTPKYFSELITEYKSANIDFLIIVIDELKQEKLESDFGHTKRTQLNSKNGILILCNSETYKITLVKRDTNEYSNVFDFINTPLFAYETDFDKLDLIGNQYYSDSFKSEYNSFVECRSIYYELFLEEKKNQHKLLPSTMHSGISLKQKESFYEVHKSLYPLDRERIIEYLKQYFDNSGQERVFASDVIHNGVKNDYETRQKFYKVCADAELNDINFYIKIKHQFESLLPKEL